MFLVTKDEEIPNSMEKLTNISVWLQLADRRCVDKWQNKLEQYWMGSNVVTWIGVYPSTRGGAETSPVKPCRWKELNTTHTQHGGITLGRWCLLVPEELTTEGVDSIRSGGRVRQSLWHIADFTQKGVCHTDLLCSNNKREPAEKYRRGRQRTTLSRYSMDDRIKPGEWPIEVIAPSVLQPYDLI